MDHTALMGTTRLPPRLTVGVALTAATALAICLAWAGPGPYPAITTASNLAGVAIAASGMAVRTDPLQKATGGILIAAGFTWVLMGCLYVPYGPLSFIGELIIPAAPLMLVIAILRFPSPDISGRRDRLLFTSVAGWMVVAHIANTCTMTPALPRVWWARLPVNETLATALEYLYWASLMPLVILGALFMAKRFRDVKGPEHREIVPVVIAVVLLAVEIIVQAGIVLITQPSPAWAKWIGALAPLLIPAAFGFSAARRMFDLGVASRRLDGSGRLLNVAEIQEILREQLLDDTLTLSFPDPETGVYPADASAGTQADDPPLECQVTDSEGSPLAMIWYSPRLRRRTEYVRKIVAGTVQSLQVHRLHKDLETQLQEVQESRARIVAASDAARQRIGRDLHDGAQQRLLAVRAKLGLATYKGGDPAEVLRLVGQATGGLAYSEAAYAERVTNITGYGGVGYLLKDSSGDPAALLDALTRIQRGETVIASKVAAQLVSRLRAKESLRKLTSSQQRVLKLMAEGQSNAAIAHSLHMSVKTVENYASAIFSALGIGADPDGNRRVRAVLAYLRAQGQMHDR